LDNLFEGAGSSAGDSAGLSGGETEEEEVADSGESTRLKLQTPLFVADALMQAAERQLDLEKTYCEDEVCGFLFQSPLLHHMHLSLSPATVSWGYHMVKAGDQLDSQIIQEFCFLPGPRCCATLVLILANECAPLGLEREYCVHL
jgi:hypothetical protein